MSNNSHLPPLPPPLVPAERKLQEITVKAIILTSILAMILAAANAYIGLLVGLTVSASIPAAAVSMGVLRAFRKSNILENNLVQTGASAGEALVSGIIFTIPALVMMGAWDSYRYWPLVSIAVLGGILGVAFTIPLRKALIVEARLNFPEGVATAEVLKTGGIETSEDGEDAPEEAGKGFIMLVTAAAVGGFYKLCEAGLGLFAGAVAHSRALFSGNYLFSGSINLSPALLGVGYIVGLNIGVLVFIGGAIGTLIGVPVNWAFNSQTIMLDAGIDPNLALSQLSAAQWTTLAGQSWSDCRLLGVGAMIVGGLWSLIALLKPLKDGVKSSLHAYRTARAGGGIEIPRTELDTPINIVGMVILAGAVPLFLLFYNVLGDYEDRLMIAVIMTVLMLVFGFLFSSVAGYMAGLVGSSNNPISGVTIATVIVSSLILVTIMDKAGADTLGPMAVIFLAGLICSSAAIAGDNMQDLKCGHILGATPWRQQIFQVIGVVSAAFVIPLVLGVLDEGQGIGRAVREGVTPLAAPQAGLMQALATGIFGTGIKWNYIAMGCVLAVLLIILDEFQKRRGASFRFPVLAVAVGVYLPLGLSVPIFVGGLLSHYVSRRSAKASAKIRQSRENNGLLLASGLITGEALMGVLAALAAVPWMASVSPYLGGIVMVAILFLLYKTTMSSAKDA